MLPALMKAFQQLCDPGTKNILFMSVAASFLLSIALWVIITFILIKTPAFDILWLDWFVNFLGSSLSLVLTFLLFPSFLSVVIGFFLERIADTVDARYYPAHNVARKRTLPEVIIQTSKFLITLLALNILLLPSLFILPLFPFVYYTVNGYLLGREFFEIAALRRLSLTEAQGLRNEQKIKIILLGVGTVIFMTLPVINLLTPIIATATMVHLVEGWRKQVEVKVEPKAAQKT